MNAALDRLHEAGVAHQDLPEENICILLGEECVRAQIIDLGLAVFEGDRLFE